MSISCTYTYNGKKYSRDRMLGILINENPQFYSVDQTKQIQWLKDTVGMTDSELTIVKGLIDNKSLGRTLQDGKILLSEFATPDVAYHEAFHRVFGNMLSDKEQAEYIRGFKERKNWKSLIEPLRKYYPKLSENDLIEEYMADEFAEFVLSNGNLKVEQPTKSLFERLLSFIKKLLGIKSKDLKQLYSSIRKGSYKNTSVRKRNVFRDKIAIGGELISADEKNQISQSISALMLNSIIGQGPTFLKDFVQGRLSANQWQLFTKAALSVATVVNKVNPKIAEAIAKDINDAREAGFKSQSALYKYVQQYISQLGIENSQQDAITEFDEVEQSMSDQDARYTSGGEFKSNMEIDPKTNMSKQIKILLGSLYDGTKTTSLGLRKTLQWSTVFNEITQNMAGVPTEEFMNELSNLDKGYINQLTSYLSGDSLDRVVFRNDFISTMANTINNFVIFNIGEKSTYLFDANQNTRLTKVKQNWQNSLQKAIKSFDSFNDWKAAVAQVAKNANPNKQDFTRIFGFEYSEELENFAIYNKGNQNYYIQDVLRSVSKVISDSKFTESNQPDYTKLFKEFDIEGTINLLASKESEHEQSVDLMVYAMGKKLYGIGLNTHMTTQINRANYAVSKFTPEMSFDEKIELLKKYAPFVVTEFNTQRDSNGKIIKSTSLFLDNLLEGNKLKLNIVYNAKTESFEEEETGQLNEPDLYSLHLNSSLQGYPMTMKHSDRSTFMSLSFEQPKMLVDPFVLGIKSSEQMLDYLEMYLEDQIAKEKEISKTFNSESQPIQYFAKQANSKGLESENLKKEIKEHFDKYKKDLEKWGVLKNGINAEFLSDSMFSGNIDFLVATSFVNEIVSHNEEARFFAGDLRVYKNSVDLFKRLAAISSTGKLLINDEITNARIREIVAKNVMQVMNPITNVVEEIHYDLAPDGFMRGITLKENESFSSVLLNPATHNNEPLISKITGKQESVIFMVYESGFKSDFGLEFEKLSKEKKDYWENKIRSYEKKYSGINENDGQSYMNLVAFKNYMIRLGRWNIGMENVFRTEMAILSAKSFDDLENITVNIGGKEINPFVISEGDSFRHRLVDTDFGKRYLDFNPMHTLKSQFSGPIVSEEYAKNREDFQFMFNSIFKTSYHILLPSAIIGTNMQTMNYTMLTQGIDVIHMGSANKVGGVDPQVSANQKLKNDPENVDYQHVSKYGLDFYDVDGHFNHRVISKYRDSFTYLADINYMKDQVEIGSKVKDEIKGSTQSLKILLSNLLQNGEERVAGANVIIEQYKKLIADIVNENKTQLLKELDYNEGFESLNALKGVLLQSALAKGAPENLFNAIENFIDDPVLETLPNKSKIENILYSLVTNNLISFDRPGNAYPQTANTGYETIGSRKITLGQKSLEAPSNQDTVAFYTPEFDSNGNVVKVNPSEIIIPLPDYWIEPVLQRYNTRNLVTAIKRLNEDIEKGNLDTEVTVKGLRIPNQQLSSNDIFKIKKFNLPTMQAYAIVPSEIVVKVGSD